MSTLPSAEKIGRAWRMHRDGDQQGAIRAFDEVIAKSPDNVDAYYGLGLAYKTAGDQQSAADSFKQALANIEDTRSDAPETSGAVVPLAGNDLEIKFIGRQMMLSRMLRQRIADVGAADV